MTTIYVDSRKRVAGLDSDFEVDLGESLHLQSDARLAVYKIRIADSFLSTDRGRYLDQLRCPQLANASRVLGNLGDDILSKRDRLQ